MLPNKKASPHGDTLTVKSSLQYNVVVSQPGLLGLLERKSGCLRPQLPLEAALGL
ncbi:hypothetical protein D3C71_2079500 [compost metagenome]